VLSPIFSALLVAAAPSDTVTVPSVSTTPVVDGRIGEQEYGSPSLRITTTAGDVRVWIVRSNGFVYIAAAMPDTSFYWGDDLVISLDADGSADNSPQTGDRQWYLRRTLDSSVVLSAQGGRWETPGQSTPMLGSAREGADWNVASTSNATNWFIELRVRESSVKPGAGSPRISFRTYNSNPRGWWSFPPPPSGTPAQRVERSPNLWIPLLWR
jgi:hypothetical protein